MKKLIVLSVFLWSFGWVASKDIADTDITNSATVFFRFLFIALAMLPIIIIRKEFKLPKKGIYIIILSSFVMTLHVKFLFLGMKDSYPGVASILFTTLTPIVTYFLSTIISKGKFKNIDLIAFILGIIGSLIVLQVWKIGGSNLIHFSNIYFIICAFLWATVTVTMQRSNTLFSPYQFTFYYSIFASIIILTSLPDFRGTYIFKEQFWYGMIVHSVVASGIGTTIYFYASTKIGAIKTSSYLYLMPFTTLVLSYFIFNEKLNIFSIIGISIIILSLVIINKNSIKTTKKLKT